MTWTIPYTFVAGTKAKANEVNENFQSLKQFVDLLEDLSASNELNIANLQQNKADVNGNFINRFQVADASSSMDAINKRTMLQYTKNSQGVISGFQLSKFDNNTISCTAGTCYDSTFEYIISSDISLSHTDATLTANSTYYVYVCGDKENQLQAELTFSTSDTTPDVPVGYEHFRRLGSFTTDASKNIKDVTREGEADVGEWTNNQCVQLGKLLIQWGSVYLKHDTGATITFKQKYKDTSYAIAGSTTFHQYAGDKGSSWCVNNITVNSMYIHSHLGERNQDYATIWWITIGMAE